MAKVKLFKLNDLFTSNLKSTIVKYGVDSKLPSKSFAPSSFICPRNMYYRVTGAETDSEINEKSSSLGILYMGTQLHTWLQTHIKKMKDAGYDWEFIDVEDFIKMKHLDLRIVEKTGHETKVYSEKYNISCMCDGILKHGDEYMILEIKSMTVFKFGCKDVIEKHLSQTACYSHLFNLDTVFYLYINRDNSDFKTFVHKFTPDEIQELMLDKMELVKKSIETDSLPNIPTEDKLYDACTYCNYKYLCDEYEEIINSTEYVEEQAINPIEDLLRGF